MKEQLPVRRDGDEPIIQGYEEVLGYEAMTPIVPYSPRETDRLQRFSHILHRVHEAEQQLRDYGWPAHFGRTNAEGKVADPYIVMDRKFIKTWRDRAANLYGDEFAPDEHMREAADDIAGTMHDQFNPTLTPRELSELWNRPY